MITTDKYKLSLSSVGDTISLSIAENTGEFWSDLVNIPLHWREHAEVLWRELDANIDDCVMREEAAKDPDEKPNDVSKPKRATDTDFWSGS